MAKKVSAQDAGPTVLVGREGDNVFLVFVGRYEARYTFTPDMALYLADRLVELVLQIGDQHREPPTPDGEADAPG